MASLQKEDYLQLARKVAREYFDEEVDPNKSIAKTAANLELNSDEVHNLCANVNHVVNATMMREKQGEEDQYIEFDLARPEKVADLLSVEHSAPDQVYANPEAVFASEPKEAEAASFGEFESKVLRQDQLLRQNLRNLANAHTKLATDVEMETQKAEDDIDKLYKLVKNAIQNGKDPSVVHDILKKTLGPNNIGVVWGDIQTRLYGEGLLERPIMESDRVDPSVENLAPNAGSDMVATASRLDTRMQRIDSMEKGLSNMEHLAKEAQEELYETLVLEKEAALGMFLAAGKTVGKGAGKLLGKTLKGAGKGGWKLTKGTAKTVKKYPGKTTGGAAYLGLDILPQTNFKRPGIK